MSEVTINWNCCPRCGHQNEPRARFCAECGLRLSRDQAALTGPSIRRRRRHSSTWLILLLLLLGIVLAMWLLGARASERRHSPRHLRPETHKRRVIIHEQSTEYDETDPQ